MVQRKRSWRLAIPEERSVPRGADEKEEENREAKDQGEADRVRETVEDYEGPAGDGRDVSASSNAAVQLTVGARNAHHPCQRPDYTNDCRLAINF